MLYNKILSLKEDFSGFNINKNRTRTHRGFDLSGIPVPYSNHTEGTSFGAILAQRVTYYLLRPDRLAYVRSLKDDNAGKDRFVGLIKEITRDSQGELVEAMDEYVECGTAAKIKKIFKDIGINIA